MEGFVSCLLPDSALHSSHFPPYWRNSGASELCTCISLGSLGTSPFSITPGMAHPSRLSDNGLGSASSRNLLYGFHPLCTKGPFLCHLVFIIHDCRMHYFPLLDPKFFEGGDCCFLWSHWSLPPPRCYFKGAHKINEPPTEGYWTCQGGSLERTVNVTETFGEGFTEEVTCRIESLKMRMILTSRRGKQVSSDQEFSRSETHGFGDLLRWRPGWVSRRWE